MISDKLGQSLKEEFLSICKKDICRDGIEELLGWVEESDFFYAPASTRFHGNYKYGLLEHSRMSRRANGTRKQFISMMTSFLLVMAKSL